MDRAGRPRGEASVSEHMVLAPARTSQPGTQSKWLPAAHVIWWLVVALDVVSFIAGVPGLYVALHQPCLDQATIDCSFAQAPLADYQIWLDQGWLPTFVIFQMTVVLLSSLISFVVGGLVAWRKWRDPMLLVISLVLVTFGATGISNVLQTPAPPPLDALNTILGPIASYFVFVQYPALGFFLLTFPNGKFAPKWTWLLEVAWFGQVFVFMAGPPSLVLALSLFVTWGGSAAVQMYRYRRVFTSMERQQTKWIIFSLAFVTLPMLIVQAVTPLVWPELDAPGSLYHFIGLVWLALIWAPLWLFVGIAILRARLYDIDVLINRALVYGILTAILAFVYVVGVAGSQLVVGALTHSSRQAQSPFFIVATTLLVAAAFRPLRNRIQTFIDQRFYRRKYDAERTLAAFSATLRTEVALPDLSDRLLSAIEETVEPGHVSLWLRGPEAQDSAAHGMWGPVDYHSGHTL